MFFLLSGFVILFAYKFIVYAQTDTLVIKLKNNAVEIITFFIKKTSAIFGYYK